MEKFNLKDDWKYISWGATMLTNLYRSVGAGIAWMILMLVFRDPSMEFGTILAAPIFLPIGYFVFLLPLGLASMTLNRMGIPYVGLVSIVCSLVIVPGDPIVWLLDQATNHKYLPVKHFGFMNFTVIVMVIDEDRKAVAAMHGKV